MTTEHHANFIGTLSGGLLAIAMIGCAADAGDGTAARTDEQIGHTEPSLRGRRAGVTTTPPSSGDATTTSIAPAGSGGAAGSAVVSPFGFQPIAPCLSESDYVRTGVVRVSAAGCSPACVRLASGGTVVFIGVLADAPVAPRALGSSPSPILESENGGVVEFEFTSHGLFPFQCGDQLGVIWSTYW